MVVTCPKCKIRLKVDEAKLLPEGSRFKCPKCSTVLVVKKPPVQTKKALDGNKILIAHSNPAITEKVSSILAAQGYKIITSGDGIDAMVKALKEYPFLSIVEVVLPKIYGFEVCKRLKSRPETKEMKFILITSVYDKTKYRREPSSLYGADEYIEDHNLSAELIEKVTRLRGPSEEKTGESIQPSIKKPEPRQQEITEKTSADVGPAIKDKIAPPETKPSDEQIERAGRLARTIINDIYLYNSAKVEESIRNNNFYIVFSTELNEGKKLYDNRIPPETRAKGDFFAEAIENFLSSKKKSIH
ncbi:MAG: response regulator [Nitrospirota bacterium]